MDATVALAHSHRRARETGSLDRPSERMRRLIRRLLDGFTSDPPRDPLFLYEVAKNVGYQRRGARKLLELPVFCSAYETERTALAGARSSIPTAAQIREAIMNDLTRRPDKAC